VTVAVSPAQNVRPAGRPPGRKTASGIFLHRRGNRARKTSRKWLEPRQVAAPAATKSVSGVRYYGHRYYSPSFGRFINKDPIEEQGGINLYSFVGNNPVNAYDYLGMIRFASGSTSDDETNAKSRGWSVGSVGSAFFGGGPALTGVIAEAIAVHQQRMDDRNTQTTDLIGLLGNLATSAFGNDAGEMRTVGSEFYREATVVESDVYLAPNNPASSVPQYYHWPKKDGTPGGWNTYPDPREVENARVLSAFKSGLTENLSVTAGSGWRVGPVGSSATLNNPLSDGLLGGTGQVKVTTSPKSGFGLGGSYYAGLSGGFKSNNPTTGTFTLSAGAGLFTRISIGWGPSGLSCSVHRGIRLWIE